MKKKNARSSKNWSKRLELSNSGVKYRLQSQSAAWSAAKIVSVILVSSEAYNKQLRRSWPHLFSQKGPRWEDKGNTTDSECSGGPKKHLRIFYISCGLIFTAYDFVIHDFFLNL